MVKVAEISGTGVGNLSFDLEQSTRFGAGQQPVNQMDQVTQQNAAMVEQSTAASHSLAKEAGELAELASKFDIGAGTPAARVVHTPVKRLPAAPYSFRQNCRCPTHGNAALKPVAESDEDNWEEF